MIALDPRTTALVLIDLQNGILGRPLAPVLAQDLVARGKWLAEKFRAAGAPVVLVNVKPPLDGPERKVDESTASRTSSPPASPTSRPALPRPAIFLSPNRPGVLSSAPTSMPNCESVACGRSSRRRRNACRRRHDGAASLGAWLRAGHRPRRYHEHGRRTARGGVAAHLPTDRTRDGQRRARLLAGMTGRPLTLSARPAALHWAALLGGTLAFVALFRLVGLPAALLLGAMAGAILVASFEGRVHIPPRSFILAQGVIGCLITKAIGAASMGTMLKQWPIFLVGIATVMAFAAGLGVLLARWKVLPGTTAIWGSSPARRPPWC